jgi:twitching motility protein PilI
MTQRISLREFQQNLTSRLGLAQRGETTRSLLGIESGKGNDAFWLLDLADSGEVAPLTGLTPTPLTQPGFAGIANVRGTLYSVVDFSAFRGGEATLRNAEARLLLIGARHGSNSALLVGRTLGLRTPANLTLIDGGVPNPTAWRGKQYADAQGTQWTRLRIRALLSDPRFLDIAL